mmetsp:Transcript_18165/g.59352  ORF Transcript_18165/g.59352 Transcript_18165/m.59352 type:complete len:1097 (+) Transcript_18165:86-3376(+)
MDLATQPTTGLEVVPTVAEKPAADPDSGSFTWQATSWSSVTEKKWFSPVFTAGGYPWRLLVFPRGNSSPHLSLFLEVADSDALPVGWSRTASFILTVTSSTSPHYTVKKEASHLFDSREADWGFTQFIPLTDLNDPAKGYVTDDTLTVECEVTVKRNESFPYDSKKETGFIGLKNQGATCYMNSLLQSLFHISSFRKAVYHMPTTENDIPSKSIPLALQTLFYKIQFSEKSVATKDLTRSFGWDTNQSFEQHDVQELNRVMCERLEEKMKGTSVEGTIDKLLGGEMVSYIECLNVDYKSNRKETFLDLSLDVKGNKDLYASFDKYVEPEYLKDDNQYRAEGHGLQDAKKGIIFKSFPPVLHLHLKRFEYDFTKDTIVKVNDRFEFPEVLDLDQNQYLSVDADPNVRNKYLLHSVLVHSGGVHGGHYYAFIRPDLRKDEWFKFDDEKVTREDANSTWMADVAYGGEDETPKPPYKNLLTKYSNAYMLVYVRETDVDMLTPEVTERDIAEHLRERLQKEKEAKERSKKEEAEAPFNCMLKVASDQDMEAQIGKELHFDLVDHEKVKHYKVKKQTPFTEFKEQIAQEWGIPVESQRYWIWAKRQNQTFRPSRYLEPAEEAKTVAEVRERSGSRQQVAGVPNELKLFLETAPPAQSFGGRPRDLVKGEIFLFVKFYDIEKQALSYAGRMFAPLSSKIMDHGDKLCAMVGYPPDTSLLVFEEIKFDPTVMCEMIDRRSTLQSSQLEDGDIIIFQRKPSPQELEHPHARVPAFLEYVKNRQIVSFHKLAEPKEEAFTLELSKEMSYDDVVGRLAEHLRLPDPLLLRLTLHNAISHGPRPSPVKYRSFDRLVDGLLVQGHQTEILYFELLDMPLPELERLKTLKVSFHDQTTEEKAVHQIRLPHESCIQDVLTKLKEKVEHEAGAGAAPLSPELRMLQVYSSRIYKTFSVLEKIETIDDTYWNMRGEEVPAEERNLLSNEKLIHVAHFFRDAASTTLLTNFGEPFYIKIRDDETLAEIKVRIRAKLGVEPEEFAKWKFAGCSTIKAEPIADNDVVVRTFNSLRLSFTSWEHYLGLEHPNTNPKRNTNRGYKRFGGERGIKISA